jgi:dUTPase
MSSNNLAVTGGGGGGSSNVTASAINNQTNQHNIILNFVSNITKYGVLKLCVNRENVGLVNVYRDHIEKHNRSILTDPFPNSGFDLIVPNTSTFTMFNTNQLIDHQVKCEMTLYDMVNQTREASAFYMYPRSSMSKTELILSNHTGIIDSGYRGNLMGAFKWLKPENTSSKNYAVPRLTKLLQVCLPTLHPVYVVMVDESELTETARGAGGFGSTS